MLRGVPSLVAKIDAADERDLTVDDASFLVVGAAKGMAVIEDEVDSGVNFVPDSARPGLSLEHIKVGVIPHQEVEVEVRFFFD